MRLRQPNLLRILMIDFPLPHETVQSLEDMSINTFMESITRLCPHITGLHLDNILPPMAEHLVLQPFDNNQSISCLSVRALPTTRTLPQIRLPLLPNLSQLGVWGIDVGYITALDDPLPLSRPVCNRQSLHSCARLRASSDGLGLTRP